MRAKPWLCAASATASAAHSYRQGHVGRERCRVARHPVVARAQHVGMATLGREARRLQSQSPRGPERMPIPRLSFVDHDDVVFDDAPLELVLCQIRFSPILALLDQAGVAGLQEGLRREYPDFRADRDIEFNVQPGQAQVRQKAPVWRMTDSENRWTVSVAVDFVALQTPDYPDSHEFTQRLKFVLAAMERTLAPGRTTRVGLRKVNVFADSEVNRWDGWRGLIRPELLGMAAVGDLPGTLVRSYSETEIHDDSQGRLTIRYGPDPESPNTANFRLDMDYWTERAFKVSPDSSLLERVAEYSDSITSFFHWAISPELRQRLGPRYRGDEE